MRTLGRKGRVFYTFLLSYLFILLIPVLMSFLLFNRAQAIVNTESNRANQLLLTQMNTYLDSVMSDVQQLDLLISYNSRVEGLLYESLPVDNDEYYRAYVLSNELRVYDVASSGIIGFYIYLPSLDMVLSPRGYFTSHNYYQAELSRLGLTYDQWIARLGGVERTRYLPWKIETDNYAIFDTVAQITPLPAPQHLGKPRGWLVIHVDTRLFDRIFESSSWTDESIALVYDDESGILAASGPAVAEAELDSAREEIIRRGSGGVVHLGERRYLAFVRDSDVVRWRYVSLIPVDIYSDRFQAFTRFTTIAFVVCLVLGGLAIYRFSVARYRPVYALLSMLKPDAGGLISLRSDEFALIADSLQVKLAEGQRLKQEIKRHEPILAQRYLKQLLKGELPTDTGTDAELSRLGIDMTGSYLILVLIDVEVDEDAEPGIRESSLERLWENDPPRSVQVVRDMDGVVAFLINQEHMSLDDVHQRLVSEKAKAEAEYPVYLAIGMSDLHHQRDGWQVLYEEARLALDFRLVMGRSTPIRFGDVHPSDKSYYFPMDVEQRLVNSIKAGNSKMANTILADVYEHNFGVGLLSLEIARCLMFDLISTMIKTINSIAVREEDSVFWSRIKPITRLMACRSFEQLSLEMEDILEHVCEYVKHGRRSRNDRLREEIVQFIHANYRDRNLGPDAIADRLSMSKAYLSRMFREQTGTGISSYVKQYRVAEAKRLLTANNTTIGEVAESVGFNDSNALIRAFKELEGMTPGQFKESLFA